MVCTNPKTIWLRRYYPIHCTEDELKELNKPKMNYQKGYYPIEVPCGHCLGCRLDHANEWATRAWCEMQTFKKGCFITLTYNEPHLPRNKQGKPTLVKAHTQQFFKNLRKHEKGLTYWINPITNKYEAPIRFMGAGEYGPKGGRPHYHFCVFNWIPDDLEYYKTNKRGDKLYTSKKLQKYWEDKQQKEGHKTRGFVIVGELNYRTACYTARYCQKKAGQEPKKRDYEFVEEMDKKTGEFKWKKKYKKEIHEIEPEFINCSRCPGIGRKYWEDNKEKIKENSGIWLNDGKAKLKPIPRYFRKIWESENWEEFGRWKYKKQEQAEIENNKKLKMFYAPNLNDFQKQKALRDLTEKLLKDKAQYLIRQDL